MGRVNLSHPEASGVVSCAEVALQAVVYLLLLFLLLLHAQASETLLGYITAFP